MTLLQGLSPMLAVAGSLPADEGGWAYEVKFDGVRVLAEIAAGRVTLRSRNDNDVTAAYPELQALAGQLGPRVAVVDGEVAVFDERGRTDFGLIQSRMHVRRPSPALIASAPVQFLIFDVLHLDQPTVDWTYDARREALLGLGLSGAAWSTPPAITGDGATIVAQSKAAGLEGIVAKRRDSRYLLGRRSPTWTNIKNIRRTSAVVVGWTRGRGTRPGRSGRCCSAFTGTTALSTPATSAPGSPKPRWPVCRSCWNRCGSTSPRWTPQCHEPTPRAPSGCSP